MRKNGRQPSSINEIAGRVFCAHKPYFLMPGHIIDSYISLGTLVYLIVGIDKENYGFRTSLESNLTITCPSNTGHKSFSTELIVP